MRTSAQLTNKGKESGTEPGKEVGTAQGDAAMDEVADDEEGEEEEIEPNSANLASDVEFNNKSIHFNQIFGLLKILLFFSYNVT